MDECKTAAASACGYLLPAFLTPEDWRHIVESLQLSPQQARIVSLILQGRQDKEIAAEMELNRYTIRTYLRRVFDRIGVEDRMALVLRAFDLCLRGRESIANRTTLCPPFG